MRLAMKKKQENLSAKGESIRKAALELFSKHGYRRTSIDDIAEAAQVAKRTVYLQYENKAAVFVAMVEYLGGVIAERCDSAARKPGTPSERLYGLLDANYGTLFEMFGSSEYAADLAIAGAELCQTRVDEFEKRYAAILLDFFRKLKAEGAIREPAGELTLPQVVRLTMRAAYGAKYDQALRGDVHAYRKHLSDLAKLTLAALRP
jgi:AcrR family transcriptional regulator